MKISAEHLQGIKSQKLCPKFSNITDGLVGYCLP